jgi:hypothetical protein
MSFRSLGLCRGLFCLDQFEDTLRTSKSYARATSNHDRKPRRKSLRVTRWRVVKTRKHLWRRVAIVAGVTLLASLVTLHRVVWQQHRPQISGIRQ